MLAHDPQQTLLDQFSIPLSASSLLDITPGGLFGILDKEKLYDVSMLDLKLGFQKIKEALDKRNKSYKVILFGIKPPKKPTSQAEDDEDADDVRLALSSETLSAMPLMKEEFIEKVNKVLNDLQLSERIALGCQQAGRSINFIHYWAFNALWLKFNNQRDKNGKKMTNKQLLEQAAKEKELQKKKIADLERQKQEDAEKARQEMENAQREAKLREEEMAEAARKRDEEARLRELELAEEARKQEEEARKKEEEARQRE